MSLLIRAENVHVIEIVKNGTSAELEELERLYNTKYYPDDLKLAILSGNYDTFSFLYELFDEELEIDDVITGGNLNIIRIAFERLATLFGEDVERNLNQHEETDPILELIFNMKSIQILKLFMEYFNLDHVPYQNFIEGAKFIISQGLSAPREDAIRAMKANSLEILMTILDSYPEALSSSDVDVIDPIDLDRMQRYRMMTYLASKGLIRHVKHGLSRQARAILELM